MVETTQELPTRSSMAEKEPSSRRGKTKSWSNWVAHPTVRLPSLVFLNFVPSHLFYLTRLVALVGIEALSSFTIAQSNCLTLTEPRCSPLDRRWGAYYLT
jgi:hypothetical protein